MSQGRKTTAGRAPCSCWSNVRSNSGDKLAGFVVLLGSLLLGCGPTAYEGRTAMVSGKVTLNGAALPAGNVLLMADDGHAASAVVAEDGSYSTQARPGQYQVAVTPPEIVDPLAAAGNAAEPKLVNIPPRYRDVGSSQLSVTLAEGDNQFDIPLSK